MLKIRIIPCLTIKNSRLVKSIQFENHRNIGSYIAAARLFNARNVDEMVVLDLDAVETGIKPGLLQEISKECFMPLALGGGIKTLENISQFLHLGADKVIINTAAIKDLDLIKKAVARFGSQCIVVSIDAKIVEGKYKVFINGGIEATDFSAIEWAKEAEKRGAGEILLTSIDHDGMMDGYEIDLVRSVSQELNIPVIACGGAGAPDDFLEVIKKGNASAVAAASIFNIPKLPLKILKNIWQNLALKLGFK